MRKLCTSVALVLCSTGALAADFGVGVSARSDDAWIYAPINIGKSFRLEPSIRYSSNERSSTQTTGIPGIGNDFYEEEFDTLEFGVGIFGLTKVAESAQIYYGARLAYVDSETTITETQTYFPGFEAVIRSEALQDGYRVGPAIGFEYLFGQHFSVGGEASYTFLNLEGDRKVYVDGVPDESIIEFEQKSNGTTTQLVFRYMF